ncbi:FkbM family methyltransferase [Candidatus Pacearchaeota archaeon]|jgi:FkbM family methyltransferase|nr:FkbM family methyltransferase [Candidatus Pacearchaeota archaeon]
MLIEKDIYGSTMLLDTEDPGLSADLWRDGTREWDCPIIVHEIVKPGWTCVEAGSNLGFYAFMECKLTGPKGRVYAIEPNPASCGIIERARKINGYENLSIHCMAVGDANRTNDFLIEHRSNLCRMVHTKARDIPDRAIREVIQVKEMTLDTFCEEHGIDRIDFLRFDIESYEVELIRGAQDTLEQMPRGSWMFAEFHTIHFEDPVRYLQPAIQSVIDHGFVPRHVINMLDASASPVRGVELLDPSDFARACCEDFPQSAPRVFWEKIG